MTKTFATVLFAMVSLLQLLTLLTVCLSCVIPPLCVLIGELQGKKRVTSRKTVRLINSVYRRDGHGSQLSQLAEAEPAQCDY